MDRVIKEVTADKAQYLPGERVIIQLILNAVNINKSVGYIYVDINDLDISLHKIKIEPDDIMDQDFYHIEWQLPEFSFRGLGIDVKYYEGEVLKEYYSTGFDIVEKWSMAPRYGFLASFEPEKDSADIKKRLKIMKDFHINVVQFYDWMYRHHKLLPDSELFKDIFERVLSIKKVKEQIEGCRGFKMLPIAYGAIYGAEPDFIKEHPDWVAATRNNTGRNCLLEGHPNYIQIMNISSDCPWRKHIVNEFNNAISKLDFGGIHLDQYGFPKTYYSIVNGKKEIKDMGEDFGSFIEYTREELGKDTALIFNAVNNWPVEIVAKKPQDVVYIEVWSPHDTFNHLRNLVLRGRELSGYKKQVILAAYISSLNKKRDIPLEAGERSARLTAASIFANGGFHLVMGEGSAMLTDPYYPEYRVVSSNFANIIKKYYDVITRYSHYLFRLDLRDKSEVLTGGINDEIKVFKDRKETPIGPDGRKDTIWTIVKENSEYKVLNMVNLMGIDSIMWDQPQYNDPIFLNNLTIEWLVDEDVTEIYWITPDGGDIRPKKLEFTRSPHNRGELIKFKIPELKYWGFVIVKI